LIKKVGAGLVLKIIGGDKDMGMYDSGYKDGANAGYKLAIDDILEKLNDFGFKHNIKIHSPKDNIDDIVTLIKFYKLAYENALNEIAESHSNEEEEIDGTMCFAVSCGCEFCEQWRILNEK
jgi:hypothetical protein